MKAEDRRPHRAVATDGRDAKASGRPQPSEEISHFRQGRARDRMAMRRAPRLVNRPAELVSGAPTKIAPLLQRRIPQPW